MRIAGLRVGFAIAALLLTAGLLAACDRYAGDIEAVQKARSLGDLDNAALCKDLAGARGRFEWSAGRSETYADNPDIVVVTCLVTRTTSAGAKRELRLDYVHNRQTDKVALDRVLIDGKPQTIIGGMLNLLLMQLE
jgi:hypothetical protein